MDARAWGHARPAATDLAKAIPFQLGPLTIDPPARRLSAGERSEMLEPRVMRVLVALGETPGLVLSRDDLIELCWDGQIVSDNAINRVISLLRRALENFGGASVRLETITKVGFRIVVDLPEQHAIATDEAVRPQAAGHIEPPISISKSNWTRRSAIVAASIVAAGFGAEYLTRTSPAPLAAAPRAVVLYRRGQAEIDAGMPGALARAIGLFRQALAVDPRYADAWAALAAGYRDSANPFVRRPGSLRERLAAWAARRALALEPDHPEALSVLFATYPSYGRWAEQESRLRAMVLRFPDFWRTNGSLALLLFDVGRIEEAIPFARRLIRQNPRFEPGWCTLARIQHYAGLDRAADVTLREAEAMWPGSGMVAMTRFSTYIGSKRYAEAAAFIRDPDRRPSGMRRQQAEGLARLGDILATGRGKAEAVESARLSPAPPGDMFTFQMIVPWAAALGGGNVAFERLESYFFGGMTPNGHRVPPPGSLDERSTAVLYAPEMLELRGDPRYGRLLERVGLVDYWRKSGTSPDYRRR